MRWLSLFAFLPLVCPAANWSTAASDPSAWSTAAAAIPDHSGEPTVTVLPCQCGDVCECDPCECPGCPHSKGTATQEPVGAAIVKDCHFDLLTSPNCIHCPGAIKSANASGVKVRIVEDADGSLARAAGAMRDFGDGLEPAHPAWVVYDEDGNATNVWVGKATPGQVCTMFRVAFDPQYVPASRPVASVDPPSRPVRYERGIALAPGETLVAIDGVPVSQAERQEAYTDPVPAQTHHEVPAGFHSHRCRNCGHSWTHHDSNAGNAAAHRCANCGRYEYTKSAVGGSAYRSGGCPGGVCGTRSRGLFGGLFR